MRSAPAGPCRPTRNSSGSLPITRMCCTSSGRAVGTASATSAKLRWPCPTASSGSAVCRTRRAYSRVRARSGSPSGRPDDGSETVRSFGSATSSLRPSTSPVTISSTHLVDVVSRRHARRLAGQRPIGQSGLHVRRPGVQHGDAVPAQFAPDRRQVRRRGRLAGRVGGHPGRRHVGQDRRQHGDRPTLAEVGEGGPDGGDRAEGVDREQFLDDDVTLLAGPSRTPRRRWRPRARPIRRDARRTDRPRPRPRRRRPGRAGSGARRPTSSATAARRSVFRPVTTSRAAARRQSRSQPPAQHPGRADHENACVLRAPWTDPMFDTRRRTSVVRRCGRSL